MDSVSNESIETRESTTKRKADVNIDLYKQLQMNNNQIEKPLTQFEQFKENQENFQRFIVQQQKKLTEQMTQVQQ